MLRTPAPLIGALGGKIETPQVDPIKSKSREDADHGAGAFPLAWARN